MSCGCDSNEKVKGCCCECGKYLTEQNTLYVGPFKDRVCSKVCREKFAEKLFVNEQIARAGHEFSR